MIHLHKSKDNKFYFTVKARNGKVLVTSETYNTKRSMDRGVTSLIKVMGGNAWRVVDNTK